MYMYIVLTSKYSILHVVNFMVIIDRAFKTSANKGHANIQSYTVCKPLKNKGGGVSKTKDLCKTNDSCIRSLV